MSDSKALHLPLQLLASPNQQEEKDQFFEALGWIKHAIAEPLEIQLEITKAPEQDNLNLPKGPGIVVILVDRNWLLSPGGEPSLIENLVTACEARLAGPVDEQGPTQLFLFYEGLKPEEEPGLDSLPPRLALKQSWGQNERIYEATYDQPSELRRLVIAGLIGVVERASQGVFTQRRPLKPFVFPKRLTDSMRPFKLVYDVHQKKADPVSFASDLASSAMASAQEGKDIEAEFQFLEALSLSKNVSILWAWGLFLTQANRLALAGDAFRQMAFQASETGDHFLVAQAHVLLARTLHRRGQVEGALFQAREAATYFADLAPTTEKEEALELLGDLLVQSGRGNASLKVYEEAIQVASSRKDTAREAQLTLKKGAAFQRMEFLGEAEQMFATALRKLENAPNADPRIMARALIQKGSLESYRKLYAMAERSYQRAGEIYQKLEDEEGLADITGQLARILVLRNETSRASMLLRLALALENSQEDMVGVGLGHMSLGVFKAQTGRRSETIGQFKAAAACFEVAGDTARAGIARHLVENLEETQET